MSCWSRRRGVGCSPLRGVTLSHAPAVPVGVSLQANAHRSNAQDLISKVPVVIVDGRRAVCDGGAFSCAVVGTDVARFAAGSPLLAFAAARVPPPDVCVPSWCILWGSD